MENLIGTLSGEQNPEAEELDRLMETDRSQAFKMIWTNLVREQAGKSFTPEHSQMLLNLGDQVSRIVSETCPNPSDSDSIKDRKSEARQRLDGAAGVFVNTITGQLRIEEPNHTEQ